MDIASTVVRATQKRLDDFAQTRRYDNIQSASDYRDSIVHKFQIEGKYCSDIKSLTWDALEKVMIAVQTGRLSMPSSFDDILKYLPILDWPVVPESELLEIISPSPIEPPAPSPTEVSSSSPT